MRKLNMGWMMGLALALAVPSFSTAFAASSKTAASSDEAAPSMSKEDQRRSRSTTSSGWRSRR